MKPSDFVNAVKAEFYAVFPNGWIRESRWAIGHEGVCFQAGLLPAENINLGHANDVLRIMIAIHDGIVLNSEEDMADKIVISFSQSSLSVLPPNAYFAMGSCKIPNRKTTATPEKAVAALAKYFARARDIVSEQRDAKQIYGQDKHDQKYFD